jgi:hypothetical protein
MAAKWSSTSADGLFSPVAVHAALRLVAVAGALCVLLSAVAVAQPGGGPSHGNGSGPTYQRKSHHDDKQHGDWKHDRRFRPTVAPDISASSFQRPYPYHLDYYKMRYGGSYAPYFGGYGVGTYNPWGWEGGFNGYPPGGVGYPAGFGPNGFVGPDGMPPDTVIEEDAPPVAP